MNIKTRLSNMGLWTVEVAFIPLSLLFVTLIIK